MQLYRHALAHVPKSYFYLVSLLMGSVAVLIICPALDNIGWHFVNGNFTTLQGAKFSLPIAWSTSRSSALLPNEIMLERKSWFIFRTPAINNLTIWSPDKTLSYGIADVIQTMKQDGQSFSKGIKVVNGRQYNCVSKSLPQEGFSAFHPAPQIYVYCEERSTGWKIMYRGNPKIFEEGVELFSSRK